MNKKSFRFFKNVIRGQAVYYLVTGIWPLVSINTFQKITGPKTDVWLVKTVGVLVLVIGIVLGLAGRRQPPTNQPEIPLLAAGSALGLAGIEVVYVLKKRIQPIYLLDVLTELVFALGWFLERRIS